MLTKNSITTGFPLGEIVVTANAQTILTQQEIAEGLKRHSQQDWGLLSIEGIEENNESVFTGGRLMSVFGKGRKRFWIITEGSRSMTTVLMPEDY